MIEVCFFFVVNKGTEFYAKLKNHAIYSINVYDE